MPILRISVIAEVDGSPVPGFPLERRTSLFAGQSFHYQKAPDSDAGSFSPLPGDDAAFASLIQALMLRPDLPVTVRLNGQSDAGVMIQSGGLLLVLDGIINTAPGTRVRVNNGSPATVTIKGYAGGG
jgi:hypothetical protein